MSCSPRWRAIMRVQMQVDLLLGHKGTKEQANLHLTTQACTPAWEPRHRGSGCAHRKEQVSAHSLHFGTAVSVCLRYCAVQPADL